MSSHYSPKIFYKSNVKTNMLHPTISWGVFEQWENHWLWNRITSDNRSIWRLTDSYDTPPPDGSGFFSRYQAIKEKYDD